MGFPSPAADYVQPRLSPVVGEAIEGEALSDVEVMGRVTFSINRATDDDLPV